MTKIFQVAVIPYQDSPKALTRVNYRQLIRLLITLRIGDRMHLERES
jgi:hypothetical protein